MKEIAHISQYGVGRITKDKGIDALYIDDLNTSLAVAAVSDNVVQLLHVDPNVNISQIANAFKDFPTPYTLMVGYNKEKHDGLAKLGSFCASLSKENFVKRLKQVMTEKGMPLWQKHKYHPMETQTFGIGFDEIPFFNTKNAKLIKEKELSARSSINFLYYLTDLSYDEHDSPGVQHCSQRGLDLQYTDSGWMPIPTLNYLIKKLCWIFLENKCRPKDLKSRIFVDSEILELTSEIPEVLQQLNATFDANIDKNFSAIISFSAKQKDNALKLNEIFLEYYKKSSYTEAKVTMDKILSLVDYLTDFPCLAATYYNAGSLALKLQDFKNARLYFKHSEKYSKVISDTAKIKKIAEKIAEINTLETQATRARNTSAFDATHPRPNEASSDSVVKNQKSAELGK